MVQGSADVNDSDGNPRTGRLFALLSPFAPALAIAIAAFVILAWLTLVFAPPVVVSLERQATGEWVVSDVPVAESAWLVGVRPGMTVAGVTPEEDPGHWESLLLSDGSMLVTIQRNPLPPDVLVLAPGIVARVLAFAAYRVAPAISWWLLVVPALTSLAIASEFVPAPVAFGLAVAPTAIGATYAADQRRNVPRFAPAIVVMAAVLAGGGWLLAYVLRFESWAVPRQLSAVIAVGLLAFGSAGVVRQALWRARTRLARNTFAATSPTALLAATVDELIPGRSHSRLLAIESERTRLASDLHADVLPELAGHPLGERRNEPDRDGNPAPRRRRRPPGPDGGAPPPGAR